MNASATASAFRTIGTGFGMLADVFEAQARVEERFWRFVRKDSECWVWTGARTPKNYGRFRGSGRQVEAAHRFSYEVLVGPIPKGLQLDHLCRNRACVKPSHLELVTLRENVLRGVGFSAINARKTHCPRGHAYAGANLRIDSRGGRMCRTCTNARKLRNVPEWYLRGGTTND